MLSFPMIYSLSWRKCHVQAPAVTRLPTPDARQKAILDALGTPLPSPRSLR